MDSAIREQEGLYRVVELKGLRRTPGVAFDVVPPGVLPRIDAIDRVLHDFGAVSPGPVGDVARPWYMHAFQDDHLLVLHGVRYVDLYTPAHGRVESFTVAPNRMEHNGERVTDRPAMLVWPRGVFHRIRSDDETGSASVNFAVHHEGFDIRTNFSAYDVDTRTGAHRVIREGHLDQPGGYCERSEEHQVW